MIEEQQIALVSVVPTMLQRIVDAELSCPRSLRIALVGGARASVPLLKEARSLGWPCVATYGMTEACSQVATQIPTAAAGRPGTVGPPLTGLEVRIVGGTTPGPIEIRGEALFSGYLGETPLPVGAWLSTGDWGALENDELVIHDRRDDLLVSGGENVSPAQVEAIIEQHPRVMNACVVGIDDREWGQRVVAVVRLRGAEREAPEHFEQFLKERLTPYQRPRLCGLKLCCPKRLRASSIAQPAERCSPRRQPLALSRAGRRAQARLVADDPDAVLLQAPGGRNLLLRPKQRRGLLTAGAGNHALRQWTGAEHWEERGQARPQRSA